MRGENNLTMSKMSEEQERLLREGDGFLSSQVSFDLEGPKKPVRRKSKKDADGKTAKSELMMIMSPNVLAVARTFPRVSL